MKRLLVLTVLGVMLPVGAAHAQEDTVPVPVTSVVEREVTVNSVDNREIDDDDDDSDKTGLWGLAGLLGLLGLAGLARKRRDDDTYPAGTVRGDTTPRGSTGTGT